MLQSLISAFKKRVCFNDMDFMQCNRVLTRINASNDARPLFHF